MGLNDLKLNSKTVELLYKNVIVNSSFVNEEQQVTENKKIDFLGGYENKILILVKSKNSLYLEEGGLNFLIKILDACKLSLKDIGIVNCNDSNIGYEDLSKQLAPSKIIFFDVDPQSLSFPLIFPNYQLQQYGSMILVSAPSLTELEKNATEKKMLWAAFKKLFDI